MSDIYKIFILFIIFISIDFYNILYLSKDIYVNQYNKINNNNNGIIMSRAKVIMTIILYLLFAFSLYYLVFKTSDNLLSILMKSFLLGLTISFTYNATNLITLDKYDAEVAIRDTAWGTFLFTISSVIGYLII